MSVSSDGRPLLVILRALGLGDFLTAIPALKALSDAYPNHRRVLAAPRKLAPLAGLTGAVDDVVDAGPLAPLDPSLHAADIAVNLHGKGPQSHSVLLDAHPQRLISFANPVVIESACAPPWKPDEHEVRRWCRMLGAHGITADPDHLDIQLPTMVLAGVPQEVRGATLIHPGAASGARRWPAERWSAVARSEMERGRDVIVTGGRDEVYLARCVARGAGLSDSAVYAGRTGLVELATLVAAAGRIVCGDTGVAHLATSLGTPSVVLFGPTSPAEWGPPPGRSEHVALWAGKRGNPHGESPTPGLLEIAAEDVLAALDRRPETVPARSGVTPCRYGSAS